MNSVIGKLAEIETTAETIVEHISQQIIVIFLSML